MARDPIPAELNTRGQPQNHGAGTATSRVPPPPPKPLIPGGTPGKRRGHRRSFPSPSPPSLPQPNQQQHAPGETQSLTPNTNKTPGNWGLAHDLPTAPPNPDRARVTVIDQANPPR